MSSLDTEEVYGYMKASKLFILPSKREGFGIVAIESMAAATPVITYNAHTNATKDLIVNGVNGFCFAQTEKSNSLHSLIKSSLSKSKRMENGCVNYSKQFDWLVITKGLARIYSP